LVPTRNSILAKSWAEIHQALLLQLSLLIELFLGKESFKYYDSKVLKLANLNPDYFDLDLTSSLI
jgi:hypothetical protein